MEEGDGRESGKRTSLKESIFKVVLLPRAATYNSLTLQNDVVIYKVHTPEPCNWITKDCKQSNL